MTDIAEPDRVRQQLTAAHERFTSGPGDRWMLGVSGAAGQRRALFAKSSTANRFGSQTAGAGEADGQVCCRGSQQQRSG